MKPGTIYRPETKKWQGKGTTVISWKWQSSLYWQVVWVCTGVASDVQLSAPLSHSRVKQNHHWALNKAVPSTTENSQFCLSVCLFLSPARKHTPDTHMHLQTFSQRKVEWTSLESIHSCPTTWKESSWLEKLVFPPPLLSLSWLSSSSSPLIKPAQSLLTVTVLDTFCLIHLVLIKYQ